MHPSFTSTTSIPGSMFIDSGLFDACITPPLNVIIAYRVCIIDADVCSGMVACSVNEW